MVYLVILTIGLAGFRFLPVDLLPEIELPSLSLGLGYPNVGPEEMERLVTQPIENAIAGVPNLTRVTSNVGEGWSWVGLDFARGTDMAEAANDVRDALDRVRGNLPPEVDGPRLWKFNPDNMPIVTLAVSSEVHDLPTLTRIAERDLLRRFEQIEGVGTLEVRGGLYQEIRVDLLRDRLQAAGLTAEDVRLAISREGAIAPGGSVKDGLRDLYVRAMADYESIGQIAEVVVTTVNGVPVRVGDVATVRRDFIDPGSLFEVDQVPIIQLRARKQSGANTVAVARAIIAEADRLDAERSDLSMRVLDDTSTFIRQSIANVRNAAVWGGLLAIAVLYFFLRNGSSTFIIALSIPISLIATFGLLYFRDLSLNQMTFGGLALGIGLIVDNAIVVLENIVRRRESGEAHLPTAASVGARQVAGAIVASTLTTTVIFLPIVFMQTITAVLFLELAMVVVFALFCSLLVALTLVPMLASRFLTVGFPVRRSHRFQERFARFENRYQRLVARALGLHWFVFGGAAALVIAAVFLARIVPVELTPETDANQIRINLRMDEGTNIAVVLSYLDELEQRVLASIAGAEVESVTTAIWRGRANITLALPNPEDRTIRSGELADRIRGDIAGTIPGAQISVQARSGLWVLRRLF
ncbi:MAG: efflux RND transporter permease subunit, partial [Puniceicoccaceae bacterium]